MPELSKRLVLACCGVALAAVGAYLISQTERRERDAVMADPAPPTEEVSDVEAELVRVASPAIQPTEEIIVQHKSRAFLTDYWGPAWSKEQEAAIRATGIDLDSDYVPTCSWQEAFPVIREQLGLDAKDREMQIELVKYWPADANLDEIVARFPDLDISTQDADEIASIAEPYNGQLQSLGEQWADGMELRIQEKIARGDFLRGPFTLAGMKAESGFFATGGADRGWVGQLVLTAEDCPELMAIMDTASSIATARDKAIRQHFR